MWTAIDPQTCGYLASAAGTRGGPDAGVLRSALALARVWRQRLRERADLARMTGRDLKDIGLTHTDAVFLASKPFWQA